MKKGGIFLIILLLIVSVLIAFLLRKEKTDLPVPDKPISEQTDNDFDFKMINETSKLHEKQNYLISPLSIAYAISMANDGASGNTKEQINKLMGDYVLDTTLSIKDKVGIANLIFINNKYKKDINSRYINILENKYNSEVLFDDMLTPDAVNNWVSKKTFDMIKKPLDSIDPETVLGLANAIAIDVEWKNKFECMSTLEEDFTKEDNTKIKTAMMHSSNDIAYIESNNAKGIIKDYAMYDKKTGQIVREKNDNTIELEYIAILPNTSVSEYMKTFNKNELNYLLTNKKEPSEKLDINLSLPKYTYDFDYKDFKEALINIGMSDAFDPEKASFTNMVNSDSQLHLYINQAIHKSHIELSENGTKAAAVTIFTFKDNAMILEEEKEEININFNKPFIYLIKEKNSSNIWFFGTVYEPIKWENNDKENCVIE